MTHRAVVLCIAAYACIYIAGFSAVSGPSFEFFTCWAWYSFALSFLFLAWAGVCWSALVLLVYAAGFLATVCAGSVFLVADQSALIKDAIWEYDSRAIVALGNFSTHFVPVLVLGAYLHLWAAQWTRVDSERVWFVSFLLNVCSLVMYFISHDVNNVYGVSLRKGIVCVCCIAAAGVGQGLALAILNKVK